MNFVLAADDAELRKQLRELVLNFSQECAAEDAVPTEHLAHRLAKSPPNVVVVAVGAQPHLSHQLIGEISQRITKPISAVGPANPQLFMDTMESGAKEYLKKENLREEFERVLLKHLREKEIPHEHGGIVIAVTGANVGSGVTTLASNLAFVPAEKSTTKVALAEMGTGVPELALDLDLEPKNTIDHLLSDWQKIDTSMVQRAACKHDAGAHVLAYAQQTLTCNTFEPAAIRQALMHLRALFNLSVLDLSHYTPPQSLTAMEIADVVIVVSRLDVPSLRLTREYLVHLRKHGIKSDKHFLVANRYGQKGQLSWKQMEEALGRTFDFWMPEDAASINASVNHGKPLVQAARFSKIVRRFRELATKVLAKAQ